MHRKLRHTKKVLRTAVVVSPEGTIYFNAANVPRIVEQDGIKLRNFSLVTLAAGNVQQTSLIWVNHEYQIVTEEIFYDSSESPVTTL